MSAGDKSPYHSPNGADTRLPRFLGSGRITGKPETIPLCPQSRDFGKFELSGANKGQVSQNPGEFVTVPEAATQVRRILTTA
jgi:hypothetical protein